MCYHYLKRPTREETMPLLMQELPEMGNNSSGSNSNGIEIAIKIPQHQRRQWLKCIRKVSRTLREINPESYTPKFVSIGPIHYGDKDLKAMHELKEAYAGDFFTRTNTDRRDFWKEIQDREELIRHFYEITFHELGKTEFVDIILLDSVFVIELLWKTYNNFSDGVLVGIPQREYGVLRDLMLLENQLPYFILELLYNLSCRSRPDVPFYDLVSSYFRCFTEPPSNETTVNSVRLPDKEHNHFTDLIRNLLCTNPPELEPGDPISNSYNVKALYEAGVKFQADPEAWPLGVKFENRVLRMPSMCFHNNTECLFRNIVAYEQCHYPNYAYFTNYMTLLDDLINTEDDVQLLVESGVVTNLLGDNKDVKDLVSSLGKNIVETGNCYHKLHLDLKEHCENCWYQKVALMRRVYFSNIWKGTRTVVALILLVFTFIQSFNSVIEIFS